MSSSRTHNGERHGSLTHAQQQRIINRQEATGPADIEPVNEAVAEARALATEPAARYDNETGERAVDHGANHDSSHRKHRSS